MYRLGAVSGRGDVQVSARVQTMTAEMAAAEVDYKAAIGQLRYAVNLQHERKQDAPARGSPAAAAAPPAVAGPSSTSGAALAACAAPAADAAGPSGQAAASAIAKVEEGKQDVQPGAAAAVAPTALEASIAEAAPVPSDAVERSSEEVIVLESDDDCVIVEGLGVTRDSPAGAPRRARPVAFTSSTPGLVAPSWDACGTDGGVAAGCGSTGASVPGAGTADAAPGPAGPVAPKVQVPTAEHCFVPCFSAGIAAAVALGYSAVVPPLCCVRPVFDVRIPCVGPPSAALYAATLPACSPHFWYVTSS